MTVLIVTFILSIIFVVINGCTQVFYARKLGYKAKPTAFAYFVGALGNLASGNIVPISAQAETLTMSGLIKQMNERIFALLFASLIGIILGASGLIGKLVDFAGTTVIYGMMAGVGLILVSTSFEMIKAEKRTGIISLIVAIGVYMISKDVVFTIASSVLVAVGDFVFIRKKRVKTDKDESNEWRFWKKTYWQDFKLIKPKFTWAALFGALSIICLNIGSNISFGTISAGMVNQTPNYNALTFINSVADVPSVLFGGMPLETIIAGTCATAWPLAAGIAMMAICGILLFTGLMNKIGKFVPAESISGFLFIIGFSLTLIPNLLSVSESANPIEGVVAAAVTMMTKNAFLGVVAGILTKFSTSLWGLI